MEKLSKIIEEKTAETGLSQRDLAEMSGVSLRTVTGIENSEANLRSILWTKSHTPWVLEVALIERVKHD